MRKSQRFRLLLVLPLLLYLSGCTQMFALDQTPITRRCLALAPVCAWQRHDTLGASVGWSSLATLCWPWFLVVAPGAPQEAQTNTSPPVGAASNEPERP